MNVFDSWDAKLRTVTEGPESPVLATPCSGVSTHESLSVKIIRYENKRGFPNNGPSRIRNRDR